MQKPMSLIERAARLREKMIATALLDLEDWSPLRPPMPLPTVLTATAAGRSSPRPRR